MSKKNHLCPYCFSKFEKTPYLCINNNCKSKKEMNFLYPKFGMIHKSNHVKCPDCGQVSYHSVCPDCKQSYLNCEQHIILPIVGVRASGKSTFCGVLIHEMLYRIAPSFRASFEGYGDSLQRYKCRYEEYLYNGISIPATQRFTERFDSIKPYRIKSLAEVPMIFNYKYRIKEKPFNVQTVITDISFDDFLLSLEDCLAIMKFYYNLFSNASGCIVVIDPLSFGKVADLVAKKNLAKCVNDDIYRNENNNTLESINKVSKILRISSKTGKNQKIKIPIAVVISKYDIFENLLGEDSILRKESPHCNKRRIVDSDMQSVHEEVVALLKQWDCEQTERLLLSLENNFETYSFFVVSSLGTGNAPDGHRILETPHPHRIEDPLLWLMKENKIIK